MNRLSYSIHSYSGHTANYTPDKIQLDEPNDQSSRWTGATGVGTSSTSLEEPIKSKSRTSSPANNGSTSNGSGNNGIVSKKKEVQFITLELERVSLVKVVGFGKYHKVHPCNLSQLSIYGGLTPNPKHMELLYHGGLRNDSIQERIELGIYESRLKGSAGEEEDGGSIPLPVKFIRIDALAAHSQNYNVSIWHVFLEGDDSPELMQSVLADYEANRTLKSSHLILSHLRRTCLLTPFHSLLSNLPHNISKSFENPLITSLHTSLVLLGNFQAPLSLSSSSFSSNSLATAIPTMDDAETILAKCLQSNLFREFDSTVVGGVGKGKGKSIARWECLHPGLDPSTSTIGRNNAPSPRGGHQMILVNRKIILFGGWNGEKDLGDLWEWDLGNLDDDDDEEDIVRGGWKLLDDGIEEEGVGGRKPRGRSCHQFVLDEEEGWIYLLGGMGPAPTTPLTPLPFSPAPSPLIISASTEPPTATASTSNGEEEDVVMELESEPELEAEPQASSSSHSRNVSGRKELNPWQNDFWRYKATGVGKGTWELLSEDISLEGGPKLLFDHQMVVHNEGRRIYVFGGKHENEPNSNGNGSTTNGNESVYSGLYSYDIVTRKWHNFFGDTTKRDNSLEERSMLMSRMGSAMLLNSSIPALYIFSGQRASANLRDLWMLKIVSPIAAPTEDDILEYITEDSTTSLHVKLLSEDYTKVDSNSASPPVGFAQRASLDVESGEWTLLSGLLQDKKTGADLLSEEIWRRNKFGNWENVLVKGVSPRGRYAGPVLYDPITKYHYMMGGNPQDADRSKRLGDLWRLEINKPSSKEALRQAKFLIRKQKLNEMCQTQSTVSALTYLQTQLAAVVNHSDEDETSAFRACMQFVLSAPVSNNHDDEMMEDSTSSSSPNLGSSTSSLVAGEDLSLSQFTSPIAPTLFPGSNSASEVDSHLNQAQITASAISNSIVLPEINLYTQRQELFEKLLAFFPESECQPQEDLRNLCRRTE